MQKSYLCFIIEVKDVAKVAKKAKKALDVAAKIAC